MNVAHIERDTLFIGFAVVRIEHNYDAGNAIFVHYPVTIALIEGVFETLRHFTWPSIDKESEVLLREKDPSTCALSLWFCQEALYVECSELEGEFTEITCRSWVGFCVLILEDVLQILEQA